jgi:hypothetical protein
VTDTLTLLSPQSHSFKVVNDGHGGSKVELSGAHKAGPAAAPLSSESHISSVSSDAAVTSSSAVPAEDVFHFKSLADLQGAGGQRLDFHAGQQTIDLHLIDADTGTAGHQNFTFIGGETFHHQAGELRFADHTLQGDVNGDGKADFAIHLNVAALHSGDFLL